MRGGCWLAGAVLLGWAEADLGDYYEFETIEPTELAPQGLKPSEWCRFSMERFKVISVHTSHLLPLSTAT